MLRVWLLVGLSTPVLRVAAAASNSASSLYSLESRLAAIPASRESARRIGEAYLASRSSDVEPNDLIAAIGSAEQLGRMSANQLRRAVRERHRLDLSNDNVVDVDGWILSRTEASLYAVVALARATGS